MRKMKFSTKVLLFILTVVVLMFAIRLFSGEDNWICKGGEWVRHGNPSASMPTDTCEP